MQPFKGLLSETFAVIVEGNRRRQARHAAKNLQLQLAERQISGKQRMVSGKYGLFANIDERHFCAID